MGGRGDNVDFQNQDLDFFKVMTGVQMQYMQVSHDKRRAHPAKSVQDRRGRS